MPAKIYRFPRPPIVHPEVVFFLASLALLALLASLLSILAPWS